MSAFQLTPGNKNLIYNIIHGNVPLPVLWKTIEDIVNSHLNEASWEDKVRAEFEEWAAKELDESPARYADGTYDSEAYRCAWAAWKTQAKKLVTTPVTTPVPTVNPPDPTQEDIAWIQFINWHLAKFSVDPAERGTSYPMFLSFREGKMLGQRELRERIARQEARINALEDALNGLYHRTDSTAAQMAIIRKVVPLKVTIIDHDEEDGE